MFIKNIALKIEESRSFTELIDIAVTYPDFAQAAVNKMRYLNPCENLTEEEFFRLGKESCRELNKYYAELHYCAGQFTKIGDWIRNRK